MEQRTHVEIREQLEEAVARRAELWQWLAVAHDPDAAAEVARLTGLIEALWTEERLARSRTRFGPRETILARARAEDRLRRDVAKAA